MCRFMEGQLSRILSIWLRKWNSKLSRTASTKLIPYYSLMKQTQLRPLVLLRKLCVTAGFKADVFQMISNLLLLAIHTKSKWQNHEICNNHRYILTKNCLFIVGTQEKWSKNLSQQDLDSLSKQLKPKKELVRKLNSQMCFVLLMFSIATYDFVGKIPLRQLVYRVHNLPPSMRPLVYDFGQLQQQREADYTHRIVHNYVRSNPFKVSECCYSVH